MLPARPARRTLTAAVTTTAALLAGTALNVAPADAATGCSQTSEAIYVHDLSDGHRKVHRGDRLEYSFVIQNNGERDCKETVVFHYSSKYLRIDSISGSGRVLKGQGQVAWRKQVIEPIYTDVDYYYRVFVTVKKTAPRASYTTYATSTPSGGKIPGMTSAGICVALGDQCDSDKDTVTR